MLYKRIHDIPRFLYWSPAYAIFFLALLFPARDFILRKALTVVTEKLGKHHLVSHWDGASFRGLKSVFIKGFYIQDEKNNENEVYVDSLTLNVRILPLVFKNVRIRKLDCSKISVRYTAAAGDSTSVAPVSRDSAMLFKQFADKNLEDFVNRYIRRSFRYIPSRTIIRLVELNIRYAGKTSRVGIKNLKMGEGEVTGTFFLSGEGSMINVPLKGRFSKSSYLTQVGLVNHTNNKLLPVPFLRDKYGIEARFDSLNISVDLSHRDRHRINILGKFDLFGFELKGERLSSTNIKIGLFKSSFLAHLGVHYLELDSNSNVYLNDIRLIPFFRLIMTENPQVEFRLLPVSWKAGDFFRSLPEGMFISLPGLEAEGVLKYHLDFSVNLKWPDSLKFSNGLTAEKFKILKYGADDYRILNSGFYHKVFEKDHLKTSFWVGQGNPDFTPLEEISPVLRAAVMTSEDGSFFNHNGFNTEAFRESIVTNIKEKRFARGGSTLTMQLVKNVFLTRNKNIARKIEEAIIVWMIENQNLVSKKRMYEVYLNLIEWGPGIYGINQASRFYFDKKPGDLNLQESIFLASIVPRPKWYKYTFDANGVTKPFFANYFHRMEELLVRREYINDSDTIGMEPVVTLTGAAAQVFSSTDQERNNSLILKEIENLPAIIKLNKRDQ